MKIIRVASSERVPTHLRSLYTRALIWIRVGQGPTGLAVDAGGGCLDIFFSRLSFLFFFPLSGRRPDID